MNATPPVSQIPIASDPAQQNAAAAANSVNSGGKTQDFAAALSNAGPKPTRKAAQPKPADAGTVGGQLPATGNLSPPPTPPPTSPLTPGSAATAAAAAAVTAAVAGTVSGGTPMPRAAMGTAAPVAPAPSAAALAAKGSPSAAISGTPAKVADQNSGGTSVEPPIAAPGPQGATSLVAGFGVALGLPVDDPGEAGAPSGDGAGATKAVAGAVAPAKGAATAAVAAASAVRAGPAAGAAAGAADKPTTAAATAAINTVASGPTSATDGSTTPSAPPPTNTIVSANTDASAQAVTAAAMSAAAIGGTAAPGDAGIAHTADLSASSTDDLATPAAGAKPTGAGAPKGPTVPAPAISVPRPAAAVSVKAAAAALAVTTSASASAADKHAPGGTGDSPLSGTSVDATGAAQLSVNSVADATPTPPPTLKVAAGVETPEFGHGLADRVSWMVDNNLNGAKLQVNPPQLGPIEVRIAVQGGHAQVWLASHSAVTRDALESSSPKLREMLGAQGFGQVSVDISQRSYQERSTYSQPYESIPSASGSPSTTELQSTSSSLARISSGAVDAYA